MMHCLALERTDVKQHRGITADAAPSGLGPADLQQAYNLPASGGAGATVAIVDAQDDPNAESDLATYRSQYGLPACTTANGCFKKVDQNGGSNYPTADAGWAGEISLDVDMVSAACPQCHILLVEANTANMDDLGAAVNRAVTMGAKFVSNSYGGSEDASDTTADSQYFNHPGVAITVSSGDSGYGVEYPAASQYVTAVGGTSLKQGRQHARLVRVGLGLQLRRRGRRLRLLGLRPQAVLAEGHRLRQAGRRRRLGGRRPGHRRRGLRQLPGERLERVRRHQRLLADHRRRVRAGRHPRRRTPPPRLPLRPHRRAQRRDLRRQRQLPPAYLCTAGPATTARPASAPRTAPRPSPADRPQ